MKQFFMRGQYHASRGKRGRKKVEKGGRRSEFQWRIKG